MASRHPDGRDNRPNALRLVLKNELAELGRMHDEITRYGKRAALPQRDVQHCILACEELVTNIISYGYPADGSRAAAGREREIICELASDARAIRLSITDDAMPYNPLERSDPDVTLALEEREQGGLGVYFVKQVMDEVRYERDGNRNKLIMTKRRADGGHHEH